MSLNSSDIPVVAKATPFSVSADQLETAAKLIRAEDGHATIEDGGHRLLALTITVYEPLYEHTTSLIRRDGLIVHEVS